MRWIIGNDIAVDSSQKRARRNYIQCVTDAKVSAWEFIRVNGEVSKKFLCCTSEDEVDGTFITAHIFDVYELCSLREVREGKLVIANTCIWINLAHKNLLINMMKFNREIELWFAKQELSIDTDLTLRLSTTLHNIGQFGFHTSLSERKLFANRSKGIVEAIHMSFDRVSPIILSRDKGVAYKWNSRPIARDILMIDFPQLNVGKNI